jgi:hypothetical protein
MLSRGLTWQAPAERRSRFHATEQRGRTKPAAGRPVVAVGRAEKSQGDGQVLCLGRPGLLYVVTSALLSATSDPRRCQLLLLV